LSRPFDDQHYLRISLETEAVNLILSKVKEGRYSLLVSPALIKEIDSIPDPYERIELQTLLDRFGVRAAVNLAEARKRAEELIGFILVWLMRRILLLRKRRGRLS
jgi:hypothetical protein